MKERVSFVKEFISKSPYFLRTKEYEETARQKNWKPETPEHLKILKDTFASLEIPPRRIMNMHSLKWLKN